MSFEVWAPNATNVKLLLDGVRHTMTATGDGWLWKMKLADEGQLAGLMDEATYKAHIG